MNKWLPLYREQWMPSHCTCSMNRGKKYLLSAADQWCQARTCLLQTSDAKPIRGSVIIMECTSESFEITAISGKRVMYMQLFVVKMFMFFTVCWRCLISVWYGTIALHKFFYCISSELYYIKEECCNIPDASCGDYWLFYWCSAYYIMLRRWTFDYGSICRQLYILLWFHLKAALHIAFMSTWYSSICLNLSQKKILSATLPFECAVMLSGISVCRHLQIILSFCFL